MNTEMYRWPLIQRYAWRAYEARVFSEAFPQSCRKSRQRQKRAEAALRALANRIIREMEAGQ